MNPAPLSADAPDADGYPELLRDLSGLIAKALTEAGTEPAQAKAMAETVIEELADVHGGRQFYFPKANSFKARRRWLRMWDDFNGHNHTQLSVQYGMNIKQVYRVLAIVREEMRRKRQGDLFREPPPPGGDAAALAAGAESTA